MRRLFELGLATVAAVAIALATAPASAEQLQKFGKHIIHYNALSTDQLTPQVASTYGLQRSTRRGLLNIAVQRDDGGAEPVPVGATVSASAANLAGQRTAIVVREIREDGAIYYLGDFPVSGTDTLRFDIVVTPEGTTTPHTLQFSKNYVTD